VAVRAGGGGGEKRENGGTEMTGARVGLGALGNWTSGGGSLQFACGRFYAK